LKDEKKMVKIFLIIEKFSTLEITFFKIEV